MGLLGDILKIAGKSAVSSAKREVSREAGRQVGQKVGNMVTDKIKDITGVDTTGKSYNGSISENSVSNSVPEEETVTRPQNCGPRQFNAPRSSLSENDDTIRTASVIRNALSGYSSYEVKEDYKVAGDDAMNASFAIFKDGAPKLYIMIVGRSTCSSHAYLEAKRKASSEGVQVVNFVEHFANEEKYVQDRIAGLLK